MFAGIVTIVIAFVGGWFAERYFSSKTNVAFYYGGAMMCAVLAVSSQIIFFTYLVDLRVGNPLPMAKLSEGHTYRTNWTAGGTSEVAHIMDTDRMAHVTDTDNSDNFIVSLPQDVELPKFFIFKNKKPVALAGF